jgi:hypothetical protein
MQPGSRVLWGCSAPPAILPSLPQVCHYGGISVLSSARETEKSRVGGERVMLLLVNNSLVRKEVWDSGFFCGRSLDSHFLDPGSIIVGGKQSFHAPTTLPLWKSPRYLLIGRRMVPRAGLDEMEEWKFLTVPGPELLLLSRPACYRNN